MSNRSNKLKRLNEIEQDLRRRALPSLTLRSEVEGELLKIDRELQELIVAYEQYFMRVDKFEPAKERQIVALRLRRLVNCYIPQVDLRFRLQGVAARLYSYSAYWDRILRLIEEGRYERQRSHVKWAAPPASAVDGAATTPVDEKPLDRVYRDLVEAYRSCQLTPPRREQIDDFLARQTDVIRGRFGDRPVEITVAVTDGKPKIKVRPRE
jgi:hypothetical protein